MNVYDFDKTIYHRDSTAQFTLWCLRRYPRAWLRLFTLIGPGLGMLIRRVPLERFKERLFAAVFAASPDLGEDVERFWTQQIGEVHRWYLDRKRADDVVISASPAFIVQPALRRLGVETLLATPLNPQTGRMEGKNCSGAEKVKRFRALFADAAVEAFYSDSLKDTPMAREAARAYLVKGEQLSPWPL